MLRPATARSISFCLLATLAATAARSEAPRLRPLSGTRAEAATLIVQGIDGGPLPLAAVAPLEALEPADEPGRLRLPVAIEVPATGLPAEASQAPTLEFYAYAVTPDGAVVAHLGLALDREAAALDPRSGVKLVATLDLPPGSYSLRILVLEPMSHRFGLRSLEVVLPGAAAAAILTRPTIEDACPGWLTTRTPRAPHLATAALPVLLIGSRVELSTAVVGWGDASGSATATVHLQPTRAESFDPQALTARLTARAHGVAGTERLDLAFDLPPIARGVYALSLELDAGSTSLTSAPTEVWVVDDGDFAAGDPDPCARTWSAVIAHSGGRTTAAVAAGETEADDRAGRVRARTAYAAMLRRFAETGDVDAASQALCDLEHELAEAGTRLPTLLRAEIDIARRLAAVEPEILPPLMLLHHEAYLDHLRRKQFPLAGHSSRTVKALGDLVADFERSDESRLLASDILTSLAEYSHRHRMLVPSQLLLQSALEMNPGNRDALLLLAVNYEWLGRYEEATRRLEEIVDGAATHSEARLRLAIMRRRSGDVERAEQELRRLLREAAPPWLLSLTYQALARLLRDQDRDAEALELLTEARERLGHDQRLTLLRAHAFDRTGRPAEARRLLRELRTDVRPPSPRFRYGQSLTSPLVSLRDGIARGVTVRMPLLTRAFEQEASK